MGGDDSTEIEVLTIHLAPERAILDALEVEKYYKGKGSWINYLTCQYILADFNWDDVTYTNMKNTAGQLQEIKYSELLGEEKYNTYLELRKYFRLIYDDIAHIKRERDKESEDEENERKYIYKIKFDIYYPIPKGYGYIHHNDFGAARSFGGERNHRGNDIMSHKGTPIVAVAPGVVERIGWDTLGGWRIGIRDSNNRYWYYAHLCKYEKGIDKGDTVTAGDVLGYIGDSGYGPVGTTGKFAPHLHIQIGVQFPDEKELIYVNPYGILKLAENNKAELEDEEENQGGD